MPVTKCTPESFQFPAVNRRVVEANFGGGDITSDGGVLLLRQADQRLGLCRAIAAVLDDPGPVGQATAPGLAASEDHFPC